MWTISQKRQNKAEERSLQRALSWFFLRDMIWKPTYSPLRFKALLRGSSPWLSLREEMPRNGYWDSSFNHSQFSSSTNSWPLQCRLGKFEFRSPRQLTPPVHNTSCVSTRWKKEKRSYIAAGKKKLRESHYLSISMVFLHLLFQCTVLAKQTFFGT